MKSLLLFVFLSQVAWTQDLTFHTNDLRGFALRILGAGFNPDTRSLSPRLCVTGDVESKIEVREQPPVRGQILTVEEDERIKPDQVWVEFNAFSKVQKVETLTNLKPAADAPEICKNRKYLKSISMGGSFYFLQMFTVRDVATRIKFKESLKQQVTDIPSLLTVNIDESLPVLAVDYQFGGSGTSDQTKWMMEIVTDCSRDQSKCVATFNRFQDYADRGINEAYPESRVKNLVYTSEDAWADFGVENTVVISDF